MKLNAFKPGMSPSWLPPKILLIMKLIIIIMTTFLMQVSAAGFAQKVTLKEKGASLENVFEKIRIQTGYDFIFNSNLIENAKKVSLNLQDVSLEEALKNIFKDQELIYSIKDKFIVLEPKEKTVLDKVSNYFSNIDVEGIVINEKGEPLAGANILILGAKRGYRTSNSGKFILTGLSGTETLITSYLGYKTDTLKLKGQKNVIIKMIPVSNVLSEVAVVNTGYQTLSKERATGSFGKPDMKIFEKRTGTMDVVGRLEGLVPGLTVKTGLSNAVSPTNPYGEQTSRPTPVIRGLTSPRLSTTPLYVVNGVAIDNLDNINPDDIGDVTVLKDAAAAAIWGSRAANGVIIITTKEGVKNQPLQVSYSGFVNFMGKPDLNYIPTLNSSQYINTAREIFDPVTYRWPNLSKNSIPPDEVILYNHIRGLISDDQANKSLDSLSAIDNRQQIKDIWYQPAMLTNHNVSVTGGTSNYSFYASMGYTGSNGTTPGENNDTYKININQNMNIGKRIKLSLATQLNDVVTSKKNPTTFDNNFLPYQLFVDGAGNSINMPFMFNYSDALRNDYQSRSGINLDYNPLTERDYVHSKSNSIVVNTSANVAVVLWKGLSFQGTYGYYTVSGKYDTYADVKSMAMRNQLLSLTQVPSPGADPVYMLPSTGGKLTKINSDQRNWTVRNQLVYSGALREGKDQLNIQIGQEAQESLGTNNSSTVYGYDEALGTYGLIDYPALANGVPNFMGTYGYFSDPQFENGINLTRFTSYFGLASYSFNSKYNLDLSWRQDHSNLFGSDKSSQNKPSWSVGGKWQLGKEEFMKPVSWVDNLAIRATYGLSGNSPYVGAASLFDILSAQSIGSIAGDAMNITSTANTKLFWEVTRTFNMGFDFGVLHNRISGSMDFYNKITTDLLGSSPVNPVSGAISVIGNLGKLVNRGLEARLHTVNIQSKGFNWSSDFIFSINRNKLESYEVQNPAFNTASLRVLGGNIPGYSLSPMFAYKYAGLDNMGDPQIMLADGTITKNPYANAKGDDVLYMGTMQPPINGGFSNTFSYKQLSLTVNMIYNFGNVMRRDVNTFYTNRLATASGVNPEFLNRWQQPGDEAFTNVPSYIALSSTSSSRRNTDYYVKSDMNVISASYAKIRDLTLNYSLPSSLLKQIRLKSVNIYAQATNFMVWKANHYGIDPEFFNFSGGIRTVPTSSHTFSLGLNVNF